MKKFLSILLTLAMMLSLIIVATLPTAAIDGEWTVVAQGKQEAEQIAEGSYSSVAGYHYDSEGFHLDAANWAYQTPWARFVSKQKVDLKEGVYMEIRIDEFNYSKGIDSWFNVMFTDEQVFTPGEATWGDASQNLIRPGNYNGTTYSQVAWYTGPFNFATFTEDLVGDVREEDHYFTVALSWDEANSTFAYTINGISAPESVITYLNEKWGGDESEAYVGFCFQHSVKGEGISCTLLKYGTSAETAQTPAGDDYADPIDNSANHVTAPIEENPSFDPGQPGIFMNGDFGSDIKDIPGSASGETLSVNEDGSMNVVAANKSSSTGVWTVRNSVSYDIADLPIAMIVTRNLCTCSEDDKDEGRCGAYESSNVYIMAGEQLNPEANCMTTATVSWDAYYIGEDSYLSIMVDTSDMEEIFSGRINAVRFDISNIITDVPGANVFDVCFVAFFASEDDANAYFENYLTSLGWEDPDADEETTTDAPAGDDTTVGGGEDVTNAPAGDDTTKAPEGDDTTNAPAGDDTTKAPEGDKKPEGTTAADDKDGDSKGGCGSVVGFGAIAIVAVASVAGFVSFKKKED